MRIEAQRFDPVTAWVDDLEDDGIGLGNLSSDSLGRCDNA
jgi:hypothetical protein